MAVGGGLDGPSGLVGCEDLLLQLLRRDTGRQEA